MEEHEKLIEVWVSPGLLEALLTRRVHCSAVTLDRGDDGTYSFGLQTTAAGARGYRFPVFGEDAERLAVQRG